MSTRVRFSTVVAILFTLAVAAAAKAESQDGAAGGFPQAVAMQASASGTTSPATVDPTKDQRPPAPPAAKPAEKAGFARVSKEWPKWLTVTLLDRGRVEATRPASAKGAAYDSYFLNRFRLTVAARVSPWVQVTFQTQDARVGGYGVSPVPKSVRNPFDLRLAYVELGKKAARGVSAIIGRQELTLGDGRLMASPDWGNVSRTYDGARVAAFVPGFRIDVFGAAPVDVTPDAFSRAKYGERFGGVWTTFDKVKPLGYVEVYGLGKHNHLVTGETGSRGDQMVYAVGVRAGGPIGKMVTWEMNTAVQRGHAAADDISAWATHEAVSWLVRKSATKPTFGVEYDYASGDSSPSDGIKQTFDQFYATTHGKWGLADQVGWRNMHHVAARFEVSPTPKLKVNTGLHKLYLATVKDSWYGVSGSKVVLNRAATSRDIGWEPDLFATYTVTRDLTVGAGLAVLLGGDFMTQSTDVQRVWTPYVMWTLKF